MMAKRAKTAFIFVVLFGFAFWLSLSTRFFFGLRDYGHDAGLFAYVGYAITQGKALYTQAWDNKGPLLYMIEALGILINYSHGIYFLELLALFGTVVFLYKTAGLFVSRGVALPCAVVSMLSLITTLEGGNLSEEYALPFTALAFYLIAKYLRSGLRLKAVEMMLVGMCISAVFLLRMNILAFLCVAVLGVIVVLLKEKNYKELGKVFLFAFLGFAIFTAPFVIYLAAKGSLKACIDSAYLGAVGAFSPISKGKRINNVNNMALSLSASGSLFIAVLFIFFFALDYILNKKYKKCRNDPFDVLCAISFFGLFATLLANSLSGANHLHYFMSFVPVMLLPTVWLAKAALRIVKPERLGGKIKKYYKPAVSFGLAAVIGFSCVLQNSIALFWKYKYGSKTDEPAKADLVVDYIRQNTEETDLVEVIGYETAVTSYYSAKRLAASNYFYYANGRFSEEAKTEFSNKIAEDLMKNHPKLIMFELNGGSGKQYDFERHCADVEQWRCFLNENYVLQDNDFGYTIYKHK